MNNNEVQAIKCDCEFCKVNNSVEKMLHNEIEKRSIKLGASGEGVRAAAGILAYAGGVFVGKMMSNIIDEFSAVNAAGAKADSITDETVRNSLQDKLISSLFNKYNFMLGMNIEKLTAESNLMDVSDAAQEAINGARKATAKQQLVN